MGKKARQNGIENVFCFCKLGQTNMSFVDMSAANLADTEICTEVLSAISQFYKF